MQKDNINNKQDELKIQKDWCDTVIGFMIDNFGETAGLKIYKEKIDESYKNTILKDFNRYMTDLTELTTVLPKKERQILESLLIDRFGTGRAIEDKSIRENPLPFNKKNLRDSQKEKLEFEKIWCDTILDFLIDNMSETIVFRMYKERIDESYQRKRLGDFRFYITDLMELVNNVISGKKLRMLDCLLVEQLGVGLRWQYEKIRKKIQLIKKKGELENEDEYRLILAYIDQIYSNPSKADELQKFNRLLNKFDDELKKPK